MLGGRSISADVHGDPSALHILGSKRYTPWSARGAAARRRQFLAPAKAASIDWRFAYVQQRQVEGLTLRCSWPSREEAKDPRLCIGTYLLNAFAARIAAEVLLELTQPDVAIKSPRISSVEESESRQRGCMADYAAVIRNARQSVSGFAGLACGMAPTRLLTSISMAPGFRTPDRIAETSRGRNSAQTRRGDWQSTPTADGKLPRSTGPLVGLAGRSSSQAPGICRRAASIQFSRITN